jgi:hypothetical protein
MPWYRESVWAEDEGEGRSHVSLTLRWRQTRNYRSSDRRLFRPKPAPHISRRMAFDTSILVVWKETLICVSAPRHVKFSSDCLGPIWPRGSILMISALVGEE